MKDMLPYFALAVAAYGAILSTITAVRGRRKISVNYIQGFVVFEDNAMTTLGGIEMINKSSIPVYVSQYGFELDGKRLHIEKMDNSLLKSSQLIDIDLDERKIMPLNSVEETFVDDVEEIKPGMSVTSYFYAKDVKKVYLEKPSAVINVYCVEQTGKKFHSKIARELVLSSHEPVC